MIAIDKVEKLIPMDADVVLTRDERAAMLELAYVAIAWDGTLAAGEITAFRAIAACLRDLVGDPEAGPTSRRPLPRAENKSLTEEELRELLGRFAAGLERDAADARLLELAARLRRPVARALSYEVVCALSLADEDGGDGEFELELQLVDALGLDMNEAEALAKKTRDAISG